MSNSIFETIMGQLDGNALRQLGQQAGVDETKAKGGIQAVIPVLLGAMEKNTKDQNGAASLKSALERDHDGSIFDKPDEFLANPKKANGSGILKHLLGSSRESVEARVGKQAGLDKGAMGNLMEMAAPLVMGALGKRQKEAGGFDLGALSGLLGAEREEGEKGSGMLGLVSGFLDADKDGDVMDDIAGLAGKLFGK